MLHQTLRRGPSLAAAAVACAALIGTAAHAGPKAPPGALKALQQLSQGQAQITDTFDGPPGTGLVGLAVSLGQGRNMIMYATKDGKYVIVGGIFGADGVNYSMQAAQKYLPATPGAANPVVPPVNIEQTFKDLDKTSHYTWGKDSAKKELWAVMDPNCVYCHKFYLDAKPLVEKGELKVHVIPVGFLRPDSAGKAAAILGAPNPAEALNKHEQTFNPANETGGIEPDDKNEAVKAKIKANTEWMNAHNLGGTPYILYIGTDGKPAAVPGYPQDLAGLLKTVKSKD